MESDLGNDTPKTDENSPTEVIDSKKPSDILGTITEVAKNGDPKYAWSYLKPILKERIEGVLTTLQETTPEVPAVRNVEPFVFEELKSKILSNLDSFNSAPFTIQRVCELLLHPEKHYKRIDKFMRGLEKNLLVVGTVEPGISYKTADEEKRYELMNGINDDKISPTPFAFQEGNVHSAEESLTGDVVTHFPVEKDTNGSLSSSDTSSDESAAELSPDEKEEAEPHIREDLESEPDTVIQQLKPLKSIEEGLEIHPEETLSIVTEVHQPTGEPVLFEKDLPAPGTETLLQPLPSDIVESPVNVLADEIPPTIEAITTSVITEVKEEVLIKVTEKSAIKEELVMTVDTVSSVNEVVSSVSETVSSVTEMVSLVTETVSSENETGLSVAETDVVKVSENMVEERGVKRSLEEGEEGIIKEKLPRLVSPEKAVQEIDLENIVDSPLERSLQEEEVASTEVPTVKETETSSEEKEDDEAAGAAETAEVPETIELEQNQQCLEDSAA